MLIGALILILIMLFSAGLLVRRSEKKIWNNGFSIKTGEPWIHFDNDSGWSWIQDRNR